MSERANENVVQKGEDDVSNVEMSGGGSPSQLRGGYFRRRSSPRIANVVSPPRSGVSAVRRESDKKTSNFPEKRSTTRKPTTSNGGRRFRLTALFSFALSVASFTLTLLTVLSGSKPGFLEDVDLLTLNTTRLGQNLIVFAPATSTTTASGSTSTAVARALNVVDPLSLLPTAISIPTISVSLPISVSIPTISIPTNFPSISVPGVTLPSAGAGSTSGSSTTTGLGQELLKLLFSALEGLVSGQGLTSTVDDALNAAEASLISDLISSIGIKQYYSLHIRRLCEGSFSNSTNPHSSVNISSCESYSEVVAKLTNKTDAIPSSVVIASTNITVPLLAELGTTSGTLKDTVTILFDLIFAVLILGLITSGLMIFLSLALIFLPSSRPLFYTSLTLSSLSVLTRFIDSFAITIITIASTTLVNAVGGNIGLVATMGSKILTFVWVSFGCALLTDLYLLSIWFVEFRRISLKVRKRTSYQVGNWAGIFREVREDVRPENERNEETAKLENGGLLPTQRLNYGQIK